MPTLSLFPPILSRFSQHCHFFPFSNFPRKQISIRKKCRSVNLSLNLLNLFVNLPKFIVSIIKVAECQLSEGINLHPRNIIISGDIIPLPRCTSELIYISRENTVEQRQHNYLAGQVKIIFNSGIG